MVLIGATGMLGKAIMQYSKENSIKVSGVSRNDSDINIDILNYDELYSSIKQINPRVIINCAAIININYCEMNPKGAYLVNSHLVEMLVDICIKLDIFLVQISTDHFFTQDLMKKHSETDSVKLVNNYAKTKYAGEKFAMSYPNSLSIRTNIVGLRNRGGPSFLEWVLFSLENNEKMVLFDDFYTSSMDTYNFSKNLFELIEFKEKLNFRLINLASSEVASKAVFIEKIAYAFGYKLNNFELGSIHSIPGSLRAESLGLDVSKVEGFLKKSMPTTDEVVNTIFKKMGTK